MSTIVLPQSRPRQSIGKICRLGKQIFLSQVFASRQRKDGCNEKVFSLAFHGRQSRGIHAHIVYVLARKMLLIENDKNNEIAAIETGGQ